MIPAAEPLLNVEFSSSEQSSLTYQLDLQDGKEAVGYVDELAAIRQAIYKTLNTEA